MPESISREIHRPTSKVILYSGDRIVTVTGRSGIVNFTGGGIEPTDLNPESAARREMKEELGIEASHIGNLEFHGVIEGPTGKPGATPTFSEWHVHTASLLVPVAELTPNLKEIAAYGEFSRPQLIVNPRLSKLAYRALVSFT